MKSRRTKALEIPPKVKQAVYERDNNRCLICKRYVDKSNACCHYIARSQGGLGIEENILTLCANCHKDYDNSDKRNSYKKIFKEYLASYYENWDEEKLKYNKWG